VCALRRSRREDFGAGRRITIVEGGGAGGRIVVVEEASIGASVGALSSKVSFNARFASLFNLSVS